MVIPEVTAATVDLTSNALGDLRLSEMPATRAAKFTSALMDITADELLALLISKAVQGEPRVCTYAWAYRIEQ